MTPEPGARTDGLLRVALAEAVGTFGFMAASMVAVLVLGPTTSSGWPQIPGVALINGLVFGSLIAVLTRFGGSRFNPAISIAVLAASRQGPTRATVEVTSQVVASFFAAALVFWIARAASPEFRVIAGEMPVGAPGFLPPLTALPAGLFEGLLTFVLVLAYLFLLVDRVPVSASGLGVGLTLFVAALIALPLTGAALNPARYLGPALAAGNVTQFAVYLAGPLVGGLAAAAVHRAIMLGSRRGSRVTVS